MRSFDALPVPLTLSMFIPLTCHIPIAVFGRLLAVLVFEGDDVKASIAQATERWGISEIQREMLVHQAKSEAAARRGDLELLAAGAVTVDAAECLSELSATRSIFQVGEVTVSGPGAPATQTTLRVQGLQQLMLCLRWTVLTHPERAMHECRAVT